MSRVQIPSLTPPLLQIRLGWFMSRILGNSAKESPAGCLGVRAWMVRGFRFANSAAKFWSSLVDELALDYPECDAVEFNLLTDICLDRDLLFPEKSLQRELNQRQSLLDIREALRETLSQLNITGPPGAVHVRMTAGGHEMRACDLPRDCIDADMFPCLLVWLLEWAEVPYCLWNFSQANGNFYARDHERPVRYHISFELAGKHVSEGLCRRTLVLSYIRQD